MSLINTIKSELEEKIPSATKLKLDKIKFDVERIVYNLTKLKSITFEIDNNCYNKEDIEVIKKLFEEKGYIVSQDTSLYRDNEDDSVSEFDPKNPFVTIFISMPK